MWEQFFKEDLKYFYSPNIDMKNGVSTFHGNIFLPDPLSL